MQDPNDNKTASLLDNLPPQGFRGVNPPMVGWYNARRTVHFDSPWSTRRWWNGTGWSMPVRLGDSNEEAEAARKTPAIMRPDMIEWQGRHEPDVLVGYSYMLEEQTDAAAWEANAAELISQQAAIALMYGSLRNDGTLIVSEDFQRRIFKG